MDNLAKVIGIRWSRNMNQDCSLMDCRDSGASQKQSSQEIRGTAKEPNNGFRDIRIIQIFMD